MRATGTILAALLLTASAHGATAGTLTQFRSAGIQPVDGRFLVEFSSVPPGAEISIGGAPPQFVTKIEMWLTDELIRSARLQMEGYLPCTFEDAIVRYAKLEREPIKQFVCTMKATEEPTAIGDRSGRSAQQWLIAPWLLEASPNE